MNEISLKESKREMHLWFWSLLALNLCLTMYIMPPDFIFKSSPIGFIDFMQHYNHTESFLEMFKSGRNTWGYNPNYMAGFPDLTVFDIDNKFVEWFALIGSIFAVKTAVSIKLLIFIELLIQPFLLYFTFLNFRFHKKACLWASLGGIFILSGPVGLFFNLGGMFSFIFTALLSTFIVSMFYKLIVSNNYEKAWLMIILTALAPIFHSTSVFMIGIPAGFIILLNIKKLTVKQIMLIGTCGITTFIVNLYWIIPMFKTIKYCILNDYAWTGTFSISTFLAFWIGGTLLVSGGLFAMLFYFKGCKVLGKNKKTLLSLVIFMTVMLILVGGPGWYFTRSLQPNRFLIILQIYILIPIIALLEQIFIEKNIKIKKPVVWLLILSILLPTIGMTFIRFAPPGESIPMIIAHKLFGRRLEAGNIADPRTEELIKWLNANTSRGEGRIMIEHPQGEGGESPFMTFYLGLLPAISHYVDGEFLGAPRFEAPLQQNRNTRFSHDEMFGRKLSDMDKYEFKYKLGLYNVKWIVALDGTATNYLDGYSDLLTIKKQIDSVNIYEVNETTSGSYFLKGEGNIKADINRLELTNLKGDDLIIKYHWIEGFKLPEKVRIERFPVEGDEVGFIRIINPPSHVVLEF